MRFKVGIDNYGLGPLELDPVGVLDWALKHGAEGVAFSGFEEKQRRLIDAGMLDRIRGFASDNGMYLEWGGGQHIPRNLATGERKDLFDHNRMVAAEARMLGCRIVRSCSGGLMRWNPGSISTAQLMEETAEALVAHKQMLLEHQVILAIETHFEFTTFELVRLFEACGAIPGEWLGICLDTMNLLTMMEDPVMATQRVLPWIVSTHIKDGGFIATDAGFQSFTAPIGQGIIDFHQIFNMIAEGSYGRAPVPYLNIEDHGGSFEIPVNNPDFRREFPDLGDDELEQLVRLAERTRFKVEEGSLAALDRKDWPGICEKRMADNISVVKRMI
jgi:sugar phosphate isomerase/epimerase